jgi:hypothetical protein
MLQVDNFIPMFYLESFCYIGYLFYPEVWRISSYMHPSFWWCVFQLDNHDTSSIQENQELSKLYSQLQWESKCKVQIKLDWFSVSYLLRLLYIFEKWILFNIIYMQTCTNFYVVEFKEKYNILYLMRLILKLFIN